MTDRAAAHRSIREPRVEMTRAYVETRSCRRDFLLHYLGEAGGADCGEADCGECDTCRDRASTGPDPDVFGPQVGAAEASTELRVQQGCCTTRSGSGW